MNKLVLHPRFHSEDWCMRGSILQAPLISQGYQRTNTSCHQRCAFSCDMNFWTTFRCFSFLLTRSRFALTWKKMFSPKNDQTGDVLLCMVIELTFVLWVPSPGTNFIPSHFTRARWFQRDKGGDRKKRDGFLPRENTWRPYNLLQLSEVKLFDIRCTSNCF